MAGSYNRKDKFYQQAKEEGYRSRAAYKLLEIQKRFKILRRGGSILDLGAWPGGWLQAAAEVCGDSAVIIGVDLQAIEALPDPNIYTICGDFGSDEVLEQLREKVPDGFHAVISDASPKLTGINAADQSATAECARLTFSIAEQFLRKGGNYVCKIFKGNETDMFVKSLKRRFEQVSRVELESSRNSSSETYVVAKGFIIV